MNQTKYKRLPEVCNGIPQNLTNREAAWTNLDKSVKTRKDDFEEEETRVFPNDEAFEKENTVSNITTASFCFRLKQAFVSLHFYFMILEVSPIPSC